MIFYDLFMNFRGYKMVVVWAVNGGTKTVRFH